MTMPATSPCSHHRPARPDPTVAHRLSGLRRLASGSTVNRCWMATSGAASWRHLAVASLGAACTGWMLSVRGMMIGAHVPGGPLGSGGGRRRMPSVVRRAPQSWKSPRPAPSGGARAAPSAHLRARPRTAINVASPNNRVRIPSRKILPNLRGAEEWERRP